MTISLNLFHATWSQHPLKTLEHLCFRMFSGVDKENSGTKWAKEGLFSQRYVELFLEAQKLFIYIADNVCIWHCFWLPFRQNFGCDGLRLN